MNITKNNQAQQYILIKEKEGFWTMQYYFQYIKNVTNESIS